MTCLLSASGMFQKDPCLAVRPTCLLCGLVCGALILLCRTQLEDLGSLNGILYNGVRVSEVLLTHGDSITFGGACLIDVGSEPPPEVSERTGLIEIDRSDVCLFSSHFGPRCAGHKKPIHVSV